jgi:hypothetical protein
MRWSALLVIGLAATLAAAAPSADGQRQASDDLTPAMPWPPPGVAVSPLAAVLAGSVSAPRPRLALAPAHDAGRAHAPGTQGADRAGAAGRRAGIA